jgi:hypothetical protein
LNTETGDISSDREFNQPAKQERSCASAHPGIPLSVRCLCRDLASAEPEAPCKAPAPRRGRQPRDCRSRRRHDQCRRDLDPHGGLPVNRPGSSDGGPSRTTSGRGRPQARRSAGASRPVRAQAPRAENREDRLESRNPVLSGGQASRATDAILTSGPLGLCRADDSTATRLMQSATAGFTCPAIIPERERPLKYRHLPTRSLGWSGLDPAVPDSHETGQSAPGNRSIRSACEGRNIRRSAHERCPCRGHVRYSAKVTACREISAVMIACAAEIGEVGDRADRDDLRAAAL